MTSCPASRSRSTLTEPTYPAPPVTRTRIETSGRTAPANASSPPPEKPVDEAAAARRLGRFRAWRIGGHGRRRGWRRSRRDRVEVGREDLATDLELLRHPPSQVARDGIVRIERDRAAGV